MYRLDLHGMIWGIFDFNVDNLFMFPYQKFLQNSFFAEIRNNCLSKAIWIMMADYITFATTVVKTGRALLFY
jgi:hypothetical protein